MLLLPVRLTRRRDGGAGAHRGGAARHERGAARVGVARPHLLEGHGEARYGARRDQLGLPSAAGERRFRRVATRVGAGERGGDLGAEGVARVVFDRLLAMRQPLRAG